MERKRDENIFDRLWKRKLEEAPNQKAYMEGENLRVDKALSVLAGGNRILDIGCGSGIFLLQAQKFYQEVHGIDISETAADLARKNGILARVVNLNSQSLPYPDRYFDCLTILSTMQYFYDLDGVLVECHRVLSKTGTLLLSVPNMRALWRVARLLFQGSFPRVSMDEEGYDGGTLHYFAYANLHNLLLKNGFTVRWAHGIFCLPKIVNKLPDSGWSGILKREFFGAETFISAIK